MFGPSRWRWLRDVSRWHAVMIAIVMASLAGAAEPRRVELTSPLPYGPAPINYFSETDDDLIKQLQAKLDDGKLEFQPHAETGYLSDLLRALEIPVESQALVFSKTSVNQALIKPSTPRAIYFNDDVTVGWVPNAAAIEITLQDPAKGTVFYTLPQPVVTDKTEPADPPSIRFRRDGRCTACHISARTLNVPGHILSSFLTDSAGAPREGYSSINHATDYGQRWGGWYVTGRAPNLIHWGNLIGDAETQRHKQDPSFRGAVADLAPLVDLSRYPSAHSDIVALLVLNHQMHFDNLVNRVSFEHRLNRRSDAEEHLIRYALMQDEARLTGPVTGSTTFADVYQSRGPRDEHGRSLRELDLKTRLFKHGVSPLIASRSFQSLPDEVKVRLHRRLRDELSQRPEPTALEIVRQLIGDEPP